MKSLGVGAGYRYAHDEADGYAAGETYLPPHLVGRRFYEPVPRGLEQRIGEKLTDLRQRDAAVRSLVPAGGKLPAGASEPDT